MRAAPEREPSGPRINDAIRAREVRLIDETGQNVGVVTHVDALERAVKAGLDLVEISPEADPPVCKILDYGKFKYEEKKKKAKASKRQHVQELKEVRMRPLTGAHDLETKLKHAREFLEQGDKVLFTIRFRGREQAHKEIGREVMGKISRALEDIAKVEHAISQMGPHMHMTLMPKPGLKPKPKPEKADDEAPKAPAKGLSQGIDVPLPADGDGGAEKKGTPDVQS